MGLSILIFSPSHILLLFLHALGLAFIWPIFSVTLSFSLPVFSFTFLGTCRRVQHGQYSVVDLRRSALCLVSQLHVWRYRGAILRRLSPRRCECELASYSCESLASQFPRPLLLRSKHRGTLRLSVVDLAPRGEGGMVLVASAEEVESSTSSACSDRPSAVRPIVALLRPFREGLMRGEIFFRISPMTDKLGQ